MVLLKSAKSVDEKGASRDAPATIVFNSGVSEEEFAFHPAGTSRLIDFYGWGRESCDAGSSPAEVLGIGFVKEVVDSQ